MNGQHFDEPLPDLFARIAEMGEQLLRMYAEGDDSCADKLLTNLWEYAPSAIVGIMRQWWDGLDRKALVVDISPWVNGGRFARDFCGLMVEDAGDSDDAYRLAHKFLRKSDLCEVLGGVQQVAVYVIRERVAQDWL